MENQIFTVRIFLNLRNAFDSLKHNILLGKLLNYDIRGVAPNLIKCYLAYSLYVTQWRTVILRLYKAWHTTGINSGLHVIHFISGKHLHYFAQLSTAWLSNISLWLKSNELALYVKKQNTCLSRNKTFQRLQKS